MGGERDKPKEEHPWQRYSQLYIICIKEFRLSATGQEVWFLKKFVTVIYDIAAIMNGMKMLII